MFEHFLISLPLTLEYVEMVFENARQYVRGDRIDDLEDLGVVFVHCIEVGRTTSD